MEGLDAVLEELLAIKLYEHDFQAWPPAGCLPWLRVADADRESYREMARRVRRGEGLGEG